MNPIQFELKIQVTANLNNNLFKYDNLIVRVRHDWLHIGYTICVHINKRYFASPILGITISIAIMMSKV